MKQEVIKVKEAIEWFYKQMELGRIRNDTEQEVYELAIDALTKQTREVSVNSNMENRIKITAIQTNVICPLCGERMTGKTDSKSFMWECAGCPGVLFEFYNDNDIAFVAKQINV